MGLNDLVKGMLDQLGKVTSSTTVTGGVRDAGKAKVVPLTKISIGFGTGMVGVDANRQGDSSKTDAGAHGGGAGGAIVVEPRAFVVIDENGEPHMLAIKGKRAEVRRGIALGSLPQQLPAEETSDAPKLPEGKRGKK